METLIYCTQQLALLMSLVTFLMVLASPAYALGLFVGKKKARRELAAKSSDNATDFDLLMVSEKIKISKDKSKSIKKALGRKGVAIPFYSKSGWVPCSPVTSHSRH